MPYTRVRFVNEQEGAAGVGASVRTVVFLLLGAHLLLAHGCHDDGDHELFAPTASTHSRLSLRETALFRGAKGDIGAVKSGETP
jgi:hypothetical protein